MTDLQTLIVQAARCRRLAPGIDEATAKALLTMAQQLEAEARVRLDEVVGGNDR